jgi:hypothetical protein
LSGVQHRGRRHVGLEWPPGRIVLDVPLLKAVRKPGHLIDLCLDFHELGSERSNTHAAHPVRDAAGDVGGIVVHILCVPKTPSELLT